MLWLERPPVSRVRENRTHGLKGGPIIPPTNEGLQDLPMSLAAGTRLGPYEIGSPIGEGGMGEVYRARDTKLERDG